MNGRETSLTGSCGACQSAVPPTPEEKYNRPGLVSIDYRIGTYANFREGMIQAIARQPELAGWTARDGGDYGIALLEMWAYVADILTFYQERIASEAFLRAALLDESVLRLARLLDYRPAPGKAAETYLAFRAEEDAKVAVPVGLRVQSVPGQDERPQKFETLESLDVEGILNKFTAYPEQVADTPLAAGRESGVATSDIDHLATGDNLVFYEEILPPSTGKGGTTKSVVKVLEANGGGTIWGEDLFEEVDRRFEEAMPGTGTIPAEDIVGPVAEAAVIGPRTHVEDKSLDEIRAKDWRRELVWKPAVKTDFGANGAVHAWVSKMRLFGHNAPSSFPVPKIDDDGNLVWETKPYYHTESARSANGGTQLDLDTTYDNLKLNTELLVVCPSVGVVCRTTVTKVDQIAVNAGPADAVGRLNSTVTRVEVDAELPAGKSDRYALDSRYTVIYELTGPEVKLADWRYYDTVRTGAVYVPLSKLCVTTEEAGNLFPNDRRVVLEPDKGDTHAATVTDCQVVGQHVKVSFTPEIPSSVDSPTVVLYGNVARAGHGETVSADVLGDGDPGVPFQNFSLKKSPVTFVADATAPHGAASTLKVRADGILWKGVQRFYGKGPEDRIYTTQTDPDGKMTVRFGDGRTGARLPSGRKNVTATYRQGIGKEGNVPANTITNLLDRPKGLRKAHNPAEASGGVEPESREKTRSGAPDSVRTFDRVVSLRDFEDAARSFVGVAKARAECTWEGEARLVRLTAAGDDGASVEGKLKSDLRAYLDARRDPNRLLRIEKHTMVAVLFEADLEAEASRLPEDVCKKAQTTLLNHFAFDNRELGEAVHLSDLYEILQKVEGVTSLRITRLQFKTGGGGSGPVLPHLWLMPSELATIEDHTTDVKISCL